MKSFAEHIKNTCDWKFDYNGEKFYLMIYEDPCYEDSETDNTTLVIYNENAQSVHTEIGEGLYEAAWAEYRKWAKINAA